MTLGVQKCQIDLQGGKILIKKFLRKTEHFEMFLIKEGGTV